MLAKDPLEHVALYNLETLLRALAQLNHMSRLQSGGFQIVKRMGQLEKP